MRSGFQSNARASSTISLGADGGVHDSAAVLLFTRGVDLAGGGAALWVSDGLAWPPATTDGAITKFGGV